MDDEAQIREAFTAYFYAPSWKKGGPDKFDHWNTWNAAWQAALSHASATAEECSVVGEVRLWDSQWLNIVNHENCYREWSKEDAISHAVKMTEEAIARNVADGKMPPPRAIDQAIAAKRGG